MENMNTVKTWNTMRMDTMYKKHEPPWTWNKSRKDEYEAPPACWKTWTTMHDNGKHEPPWTWKQKPPWPWTTWNHAHAWPWKTWNTMRDNEKVNHHENEHKHRHDYDHGKHETMSMDDMNPRPWKPWTTMHDNGTHEPPWTWKHKPPWPWPWKT